MNNELICCKEENCSDIVYARGYCIKHYKQFMKKGYTYKSQKDKNNFILDDETNTYQIELLNSEKEVCAIALIDVDEYDKCKNLKWHFDNSTGYAVSLKDKSKVYLHRFIFNSGELVDHINRNKLDCRKSNLRKANRTENSLNQNLRSDNTSGVRGVSYNNRRNKWESYIKVNKKRIPLGYYSKKDDAIKARLKAEKEYFGEFGSQKNLYDKYIKQ